jgi:hypothetical protein
MRQLTFLLLGAVLAVMPATAAPKKREPSSPPVRTVLRLAPDFSFPGPGNKTRTLRSLRGQPVVLVIARSPRDKLFRKQVDRLHEAYTQFAARQAVFVAAFSRDNEGVIKSDIPWAIANNGPAVSAAYGVEDDFNIVMIGKDGNVDYQTSKLLPPERVGDVLQNSYTVQAQARK